MPRLESKTGQGKLAERVETSIRPFPLCMRRAEHPLVALPTSEDLLICAKDLFVGAEHVLLDLVDL